MAPNLNLTLDDIGKKFYNRWIFKGLNLHLKAGDKLALIGSNGSGKSTLLRIIAGQLSPTTGHISYQLDSNPLSVSNVYKYISWSAPYIEIYPDLTLKEHLKLHFQFKSCILPKAEQIIDILELNTHADKRLRFYSSGMLQRVKVGTALFSEAPLLLLDEPTSNMDADNANKILSLIDQYINERIFILASNMDREFTHIDHVIRLGE